MPEYNEKNRSLALIIVCKVFHSLCNFLGRVYNHWRNAVLFNSSNLIAIGQILWMYLYLSQNIFQDATVILQFGGPLLWAKCCSPCTSNDVHTHSLSRRFAYTSHAMILIIQMGGM